MNARTPRLVLPKPFLKRLEGAGIYCQTWVTPERQARAVTWNATRTRMSTARRKHITGIVNDAAAAADIRETVVVVAARARLVQSPSWESRGWPTWR